MLQSCFAATGVHADQAIPPQSPDLFSFVPHSNLSHVVVRSGGQIQLIIEPQDVIHTLEVVQTTIDFTCYLDKTRQPLNQTTVTGEIYAMQGRQQVKLWLHTEHGGSYDSHLVQSAEYVGVVLLEAPNSSQTRKSPRYFIPVKNSKIRKAQW